MSALLHNQRQDTQATLAQTQADLSSTQDNLSAAQADLAQAQVDLAKAQADRDNANSAVAQLNSERDKIKADLDKANASVSPLQNQLNTATTDCFIRTQTCRQHPAWFARLEQDATCFTFGAACVGHFTTRKERPPTDAAGVSAVGRSLDRLQTKRLTSM
jgi:uncharacterized protein (DUF3084 family)